MTIHLPRFIALTLASACIAISVTELLPFVHGMDYQQFIDLMQTVPDPLNETAICSVRYGGDSECKYIAKVMTWTRVAGYGQCVIIFIAFLIEMCKRAFYSCEAGSCNYDQRDEGNYMNMSFSRHDPCSTS